MADNVAKASQQELIRAADALPEQIYLLPIHSRPFFPAQIQPLVIPGKRWHKTLKKVKASKHKVLGLSFVNEIPPERLVTEDFSTLGTIIQIHRADLGKERSQFIAQGITRFRITQWLSTKPPYLVEVEYLDDEDDSSDEARAYSLSLISGIKELLPLNPLYGEELKQYLGRLNPNEHGSLADFAAAITSASGKELQEVLSTLPILERMKKVLPLLYKEIEVAKLHDEISDEVNRKVQKRQREFFLREQLQIIQRELGITKDDKTAELDELKAKLKGKTLPKAVEKRVEEEFRKFSLLETGSSEFGQTRNYLDWLVSLPWGIHTQDKLELAAARKILNKQHYGLEDVKERLIEFLAEGHFKGEVSGSILLLVGPPGTGKTSIGKSVAEALGRKFYRFSLGGMRDEAEIKGHRRTYVGALPGRLVQALKEAGSQNPVIMLDEIDKLGSSHQGDPASALLEVLDPEQNSNFLDHYLDVRLDLSKVLFICTANQLDSLPAPLLDRMEVIRLAGYIAEEKLAIAKNYLWPRLLKKAKVEKKQVNLTPAAQLKLIEGYAREAGVRSLEKKLHQILRKSAVKLLEDKELEKVTIGVNNLEDFAGLPVHQDDNQLAGVGVVTGLAWTARGGATLPVEAVKVHNLDKGIKLTGKLGEVMQESAQLAYSYLVSNADKFKVKTGYFDKACIHLHVPEGAVPKDGPSAGITLALALLSLALNKKPAKLAMTGELSLTGKVLAVGGIREKLVAAKRSKITKVLLPATNQRDYEELPDNLKQDLEVIFVSDFAQVVAAAFDG